MTRLLPAVFAFTLTACAHESNQVARATVGSWRSAAAEDLGNGSFGTRAFVLEEARWSIVFTLYADAALTTPLLAFDAAGPWKVGAASSQVEGAHEAVFDFERKALTLLSPDAAVAKGLGLEPCGLTVGQAKDISRTGCSFFASVEQAPREFDLVRLEGTTLRLGARPADGDLGTPQKRPTALGAPLQRAAK